MRADAAPPVHVSSPRRSGYAAVALGAAAATIYLPVLSGLVRQWGDDPNASYGAFVAAAAVVAAAQRWPRVRALPLCGSRWGAAAVAGGAALHVAATLAADVFLLRISSLAIGVGALWFICGTAHVRALAAPLLLCAAAVPPPAALVTEATMPLQLAASQLAAGLLGVAGFEVLRDGNVLTLSYITLEVAEACSGMRSIVTLVALVAVYAGTLGPPAKHVVVLLAAVVPVALSGNALRVVATALLASRMGDGAVRGFVHDATGFAAFAVMCAALAGIHLLAARGKPLSEAAA